jgi:iron complex transport system substrate-binding protein
MRGRNAAALLSLCLTLGSHLSEPVHAGGLVSLDLCGDWLLAHYAKRESIAALSPMARRHPPPWSDRAWPTHDGSLEHIITLKPDRVIVGAFNAPVLRQRLATLGFTVIALEFVTDLDSLSRQRQRLLAAIDEFGARSPAAALQATVQERAMDEPNGAGTPSGVIRNREVTVGTKIHESGKASSPGSRGRLLLLGPNGYGTGPGTFEAALIRAAGWQNHLQVTGHRPLDLEALVQNPPDAILWTSPPGPALADRFSSHRALARAVPDDRWLKTDYWRWQCPGPWSLELIQQLNR